MNNIAELRQNADDFEKFKSGIKKFFDNVDEGEQKVSTINNHFLFLSKYGYKASCSFGKGNLSHKPFVVFIRIDSAYKGASHGVYCSVSIERGTDNVNVKIDESQINKITYKVQQDCKQYNENNKPREFKRNDLDNIVDRMLKDMEWFANLPLDSIKEIANTRQGSEIHQSNIDLDQNKGDIMDNKAKTPPLNQILYGPPGTGKTYSTINKALEILRHYEVIDEIPESREDKRKIFDKYRANKQIEFVTFHQSFSYEEFVEGIKPNTNNPENMIYEPKAGIFKEICKSALKILQDSPKTKEVLQDEEIFENTLDEFLSCLVKNKTTIKKSNTGSFQISRFDEDKIYISTPDTPRNVDLKIDTFAKILQSDKEFNTAQSIWNEFVGYYRDQRATYYFQLYNKFRNFEKTYSKPQAQNVDKVVLKPYILIIDEINRGNISKILGELITLIEPSKRIGGNEELRVTLPYSNATFGVPSNLYIIGTMNTADRSIALLDTALRRRFEFVEMMPEWNNEYISTDCEGVNLQKLLKHMNERIEFLLDREHTIGHSFFIGVDSLDTLREVFKLKIIPLLQEYFYDDYAKIDAVLNGNGMVEIIEAEVSKLFPKKDADLDLEDKKIYKIKPFDDKIWDNPQTYQSII